MAARRLRRKDADPLTDAVRALLRATPAERTDPQLVRTPLRVARSLRREFLDGYGQTPRQALGVGFATDDDGPILVRDIDFHGLCPHHLLPYRGRAHVAYQPGRRAVGFSRMARLVDCLAHRLWLQERVTREVAHCLVAELGARAAVCVLETDPFCLTLRGTRRPSARVLTRATAGDRSIGRDLVRMVERATLRDGEQS